VEALAEDLLARAEAAYTAAIADPAQAGPEAEAVIVQARRDGHIEALVIGLRAQAWSARALLEGHRARRLLNEAVRLAEHRKLDVRLGEVLIVRAIVHQELGHPREAQRDLTRAAGLLGDSPPPQLEFQGAILHHNAGRLVDAAHTYRRLLRDPRTPVDIRAKAACNLGLIEAQHGKYGVALALLAQARDLAVQVGPSPTAYFAEGEAWVLAHAGRLPESLRLFADAEQLFRDAGLPLGELHAEHADVMLELRLLPEARLAADRAVREFTVPLVPLMQAEAELRMARVALVSGDVEDAADAADRAAESFRRQRRVGWSARAQVVGAEARLQAGTASSADLARVRRAARTLDRLALTSEAVEGHLTAGRLAVLLDRPDWATESLDRAHALARRAGILTRLRGRMAAATAASLHGDHRATLRHCRAGVADLERHRVSFGSTELRVLASGHGVELGQIALRAMIGSSSPLDVFTWMERNRAAALTSVQRTTVEGFADEFEQLRSMDAEIRSTGGGSPALIARHSALEQRLRRLTWEHTATSPATTSTTSAAEIRELLGDSVLVEYGLLDGEVFAAVVSRAGVSVTRLASLAVIRDELQKVSFSLRILSRRSRAQLDPRQIQLARERISRLRMLLVEPLSIPPDHPLVLVPVDVLQSVPWTALHDAPVSLSPSASFWSRSKQAVPPRRDHVVLVAGPGLPAAVDEVRRIAGVQTDPVVLCPPDSTVSRVADALEDARTAHFACHGLVRADNPMFSALALSDGDLTVQELELRDLAPYRVVLAACEATADVSYTGGEMLGFVSALMARGTAGVLGSIQLVPDQATSSLMVTLHEQMRRHESLGSALHAARASLDREDPADLVNWCSFTAYGAG
jgi:tetratricopeptide (TPR) repeat protein